MNKKIITILLASILSVSALSVPAASNAQEAYAEGNYSSTNETNNTEVNSTEPNRSSSSKINASTESTNSSSDSTNDFSESTNRFSDSTNDSAESTDYSSDSTNDFSESTNRFSDSTNDFSESTNDFSDSTNDSTESTDDSSKSSNDSSESASSESSSDSSSDINYSDESQYTETMVYKPNSKTAGYDHRYLQKLIDSPKVKVIEIAGDIELEYPLKAKSGLTIKVLKDSDGKYYTITRKGGTGGFLKNSSGDAFTRVDGVHVIGGSWVKRSPSSEVISGVQFARSKNITLEDMTIVDGYRDHAIELIACSNVTVKNCTIRAKGSCPSDCIEDQIQIDIATQSTAPNIPDSELNEKGCKNITITGCNISGARAICANCPALEKSKSHTKNYHSGITVKNCTLKGKVSEGMVLYNTTDTVITGNKIISNAKVSRDVRSYGFTYIYQYGTSPKAKSFNRIVITGNTISGGAKGFKIGSYANNKLGTVVFINNTISCHNGKENDVQIVPDSYLSMKNTGNKLK